MSISILTGDCREVLTTLPACSVQCVVTSPPYFGLRDYGTASWEGGDAACDHRAGSFYGEKSDTNRGSIRGGPFRDICGKCGARRVDSQIGLESTPDAYVDALVAVFRDVRRVLRNDGTLWLNLGDSYASTSTYNAPRTSGGEFGYKDGPRQPNVGVPGGFKPKDLLGIPWLVAFALRAEGWYLRSEIIWEKGSCMPESVEDRPTRSHETVFLLTKRARYFYDAEAIREGNTPGTVARLASGPVHAIGAPGTKAAHARGDSGGEYAVASGRNCRSVWRLNAQPLPMAHFATMAPKLAARCIKAGTSQRGACDTCGAPWRRVVERAKGAPTFKPLAITEAGALPDGGVGTHRNLGGHYQKWLDANPPQTTGWAPTCACEANTGTGRCVVLDPFGGAGTTGLVADRLGRNAVLIELNPEYVALADARIRGDAPLFADITGMTAEGGSDS